MRYDSLFAAENGKHWVRDNEDKLKTLLTRHCSFRSNGIKLENQLEIEQRSGK